MYFKLMLNSTAFGGANNLDYPSYKRYIFQDLQGVIMGTITAASGLQSYYFNQSTSIITGSRPSTGIYHTTGCYDNLGSSDSSNEHYFQFYKKHHGYLQDNTNANMQRGCHIYTDSTYCIFPRMGTNFSNSKSGISNRFPNSMGGWLDASSSSDPAINYNNPHYWHSIEGIVNDKVFMLKVNRSQYTTSAPDMIFMMVDQEYQANYDNYTRSQFQYHCPTVAIYHAEFNLEQNNTVGKTSTSGASSGNLFGKVQMYGLNYPNGSNHSDSYSQARNMGQYTTNTSYSSYASLMPPPWYELYGRSPIANGDRGFIMQPLLFVPQIGLNRTAGNHKDHKEWSRLVGLWRTADDSFYSGERVLDGDNNAYRAFRAYKVAGIDTSSSGYTYQWDYSYAHSRSAVYLLPEGGT
tara:strand:+ start:1556 stop:2776 length:1221 start_codon:yes stop_codon:yes gene_type:complete